MRGLPKVVDLDGATCAVRIAKSRIYIPASLSMSLMEDTWSDFVNLSLYNYLPGTRLWQPWSPPEAANDRPMLCDCYP